MYTKGVVVAKWVFYPAATFSQADHILSGQLRKKVMGVDLKG